MRCLCDVIVFFYKKKHCNVYAKKNVIFFATIYKKQKKNVIYAKKTTFFIVFYI